MATATATKTYDCMHDRPTLEPNSDISGLGVLVGFMGTAYLSILVLTGNYFLAFQPDKSPFGINKTTATTPNSRGSISDDAVGASSTAVDIGDTAPLTQTSRLNDSTTERSSDNRSNDDWAPNPIDKALLDSELICWLFPVRRKIAVESRLRDKIEEAFNNCMLFFADAQLLTGLGILISAYATLGGESGISAYHWNIAVYLAWFSNITHLLVLTFLRKFLSHNTKQRNWRVAGMSCLFILLLVALFPTAYFDWDLERGRDSISSSSSYARCFFNTTVATERMEGKASLTDILPETTGFGMVISMVLVVFNYTTRLVKISRRMSLLVRQSARRKVADKLKRLVKRTTRNKFEGSPRLGGLWDQLIMYPLVAIVITARIYADFYASMFCEVWWAWSTATWVTLRIIKGRMSAEVSEGDMGFGQVMAVLLLASPTILAGVTLLPLFKLWVQQQPSGPPLQPATEHSYTECSEFGIPERPRVPAQQEFSIEISGRQRLTCRDNCSSCGSVWSTAATALSFFQILMTTVFFLVVTHIGYSNSDIMSASTAMTSVFQVLNCMCLIAWGIRSDSAGNETSQTRTWSPMRLADPKRPGIWLGSAIFILLPQLFVMLDLFLDSISLEIYMWGLFVSCPWAVYAIHCCAGVLLNKPME